MRSTSSLQSFLFPGLLISILGLLAYGNSLQGEFLYDDINLIQNNPAVTRPFQFSNFFTENITAGTDWKSNFYRPLQMISYRINYGSGGLNVIGYHLTNLTLHILVALAIYRLVGLLFSDAFLSLATAALYVVHPIHTEAVSYISSRADPMAAFLLLLGLIYYIKLQNRPAISLGNYVLLGAIDLCALLSKEYSLIFPILVLFYHLVFKKRIKGPGLIVLVAMAAVYITLRLTFFRSFLSASLAPAPETVFDRLPGFFAALLNYVRLLFVPFGLHMEYGSKLFQWSDPQVIGGGILALGLVLTSCAQRNNKIILFSLGWFFIALLPQSNLYRINAYMAEHFLYVPSLGFFMIVGYLLSFLYHNRNHKVLSLVMATGLVLLYLVLTIVQNRYWQNQLEFYKRTLVYAPNDPRIYYNLGSLYMFQRDFPDALNGLSKAIALDPAKYEAYLNRGVTLCDMDLCDKAMPDFNTAIDLAPRLAKGYFNRGIAYGRQGEYELAIKDLDKAIELKPDYSLAYTSRNFLLNALKKASPASAR